MLNRRRAMLGWLIYTAAKPVAKHLVRRKAKQMPPKSPRSKKKSAAILAGLAAVGAALMFWRSGSDSSLDEPPDS